MPKYIIDRGSINNDYPSHIDPTASPTDYANPDAYCDFKTTQEHTIQRIVIHDSFSPNNLDNRDSIHRWHVDHSGFDAIGYHFVILNGKIPGHSTYNEANDGIVEVGRPWWVKGEHVAGKNSGSLGICLVGRVTREFMDPYDLYTEKQIEALSNLVNEAIIKFNIPNDQVFGHVDFLSKKTFNIPSSRAEFTYTDLTSINYWKWWENNILEANDNGFIVQSGKHLTLQDTPAVIKGINMDIGDFGDQELNISIMAGNETIYNGNIISSAPVIFDTEYTHNNNNNLKIIFNETIDNIITSIKLLTNGDWDYPDGSSFVTKYNNEYIAVHKICPGFNVGDWMKKKFPENIAVDTNKEDNKGEPEDMASLDDDIEASNIQNSKSVGEVRQFGPSALEMDDKL